MNRIINLMARDRGVFDRDVGVPIACHLPCEKAKN
jgi:hypothetical protein